MKAVPLSTRMVILLALGIALTSSSMGKNRRFVTAHFRQSNMGTTCGGPEFLPASCTPFNTGVLCKTTVGGATRTWYVDACVTPEYQWP